MNAADLPEIQYTVWPADLYGHRFRVKLHIANPNPAGQVLQMPAWIPGSYLIRDFSKHIESIKAFIANPLKKKIALGRIDNDQWLLPAVDGAVAFTLLMPPCAQRILTLNVHFSTQPAFA
jgi:predicted metalloprotease with PDZ domain